MSMNYGVCIRLWIAFIMAVMCVGAGAQCGNTTLHADVVKGCVPLSVQIYADSIKAGTTLEWDFGKGFSSGTDTTYKIFTLPGTYKVRMRATLANGKVCGIVSLQDSILVSPPPQPYIVVLPGKTLCSGVRKITYIDSTIGSASRDWVINGKTNLNGTQSITDSFYTTGYKSLVVNIDNGLGCTSVFSDAKFVNVTDSAAADFCATIKETSSDITADFSPSVFAPDRTVSAYAWSFSGGTPSTSSSTSPTGVSFPTTGYHAVSLTITLNDGCTFTKTIDSFIQPFIGHTKDTVCLKQQTVLTNKVKKTSRKDFEWQLSGSSKHDTVNFTMAGKQDYTLTYKYSLGTCTNRVTCPGCVFVKGPRANFDSKSNSKCKPNDTMTINNQTDITGSGSIIYTWLIDDTFGKNYKTIGPTSTRDLKISFPAFGVWSVSLVAKGSTGCADTFTTKKYLFVQKPKAAFKADTTTGCLNKNFEFYNLTTPRPDPNNPFKYGWYFQHSDSNAYIYNSTNTTVSYTPPIPGEYNLMMVATSIKGCSDTFNKIRYFKVNGEVAKLTSKSLAGCPPVSMVVSSSIINKYPYTAANVQKMTWSYNPVKGDTLVKINDTAYRLDIKDSGCYIVKLLLKDSNQCYSAATLTLCAGSDARFNRERPQCLGDSTPLFAGTNPLADKFKWSIQPSNVAVFSPSDTVANPYIRYYKDTAYTLSLRTSKTTNGVTCYGSFDSTYNIRGMRPGFTANKTIAYCAPTLVSFTNSSRRANKYIWDWGDGSKSISDTQKIVSHVYSKNNPAGYNVIIQMYDTIRLCSMLYVYPTPIKVVGPAPDFKLSAKKSCDSLDVFFTDSSKNVNTFLFNYDDGSPQLKNKMNPHRYRIKKSTIDSEVYYPVMLAQDSKNCKYFAQDTVIIYRSPKINFTANANKGCPPLTVQFTDSTKGANHYRWYFENDSTVSDTSSQPKHIFTKAGDYDVRLFVSNSSTCFDSSTYINFIKVFKAPVADFYVSDSVSCPYHEIKFTSLSYSAEDSIKFLWWKFDEASTPDTTTEFNPYFTYYTPGRKNIKLIATDRRGCTDTLARSAVRVKDTFDIPVSKIYYVNVDDSHQISIRWSRINKTGFSFYQVTRDSFSSNPVYKTYIKNDTFVIDNTTLNTHQKSYCYNIRSSDECSRESATLKKHCTMLLSVRDSNGISSLLRWSPYLGWDSVASYSVFKKEAGKNFNQVAVLAGNITYYNDTGLCDKKYTYFILARGMNSAQSSSSNKVVFQPSYKYQNPPLQVWTATVQDKNYVKITWQKSSLPNIEGYVISREDVFSPQPVLLKTADTFYTDVTADVMRKSYLYHVAVIDKCGNLSSYGTEGTSIHLSLSNADDKFNLSWNPYRNWLGGVAAYSVMIKLRNNTYAEVAKLSGADTSFIYNTVAPDADSSYCFKIIAFQNGGRKDSSVSNAACGELASRIFCPNAFTPNDDSLNMVWKPSSLFLHNGASYSLKIYNRWGENVFETNDVSAGWNGYYHNTKAEAGYYFFILRAEGIDKQNYFKKGSILLLR